MAAKPAKENESKLHGSAKTQENKKRNIERANKQKAADANKHNDANRTPRGAARAIKRAGGIVVSA